MVFRGETDSGTIYRMPRQNWYFYSSWQLSPAGYVPSLKAHQCLCNQRMHLAMDIMRMPSNKQQEYQSEILFVPSVNKIQVKRENYNLNLSVSAYLQK